MDQTPLINKISYYFSFIVVALYLAIGIVFLFTDIAIETFPLYREMVGGLLIVYAVYRAYAIIKKHNNQA